MELVLVRQVAVQSCELPKEVSLEAALHMGKTGQAQSKGG